MNPDSQTMRPSVNGIIWSDVLLHTVAELAIATITYFILVVDFPAPALYTILHQKVPHAFPWQHISLPVYILGYVVLRMGWFLIRSLFRKKVS
ncbi:MAG: hypothetical protein KIS94_06050 [Chitinophagales bacterium]|nr:hypothetical protein [Chitinophagales bacterium]